jgi:hypothetical protein
VPQAVILADQQQYDGMHFAFSPAAAHADIPTSGAAMKNVAKILTIAGVLAGANVTAATPH